MDPTYFTCTLGQAAALGTQQPHKTVGELVEANAHAYSSKPAVGFPQPGEDPEDEWSCLVFTFGEIKLGSEHAAGQLLAANEQQLSKRRTVGLLCPSTPDFLFTWLALMRLGHAVLLIAPQCQPLAIASLCKTCEVELLFYDDVYGDLARSAAQVATNDNGQKLEVAGLPFPASPGRTAYIPQKSTGSAPSAVAVDEADVAYLHHTSGTSSGMPKPIPQSHRAGVGVLPFFSEGYQAATFTTTPLYHGGIADLFRAWTSGAPIWLFPGKRVPITASNIVKCLDVASKEHEQAGSARVKYFSSVPYVLQMLEADSRGLQYLQRMKIVGVGGAALPAEVGNRLVEKGVNLISRFGSAECGFLLSSHREYSKDKEWQYLRVASGAEKYVRFEPQSDEGLAELVVLPGWPHMAKRNREDGSFATSDLFAPHESLPDAWRYHSRSDSQLTLITGKKFDPAPLETSIATSKILDDVLIFGTGRPYPGALLFRSPNATDLSDDEVLEQIWPAVEKLNNESQDHARISRAMLVTMPVLEQPLEKSSKGTILRGAVEKRFAPEIEHAYDHVDGADNTVYVPDEELPETIRDMVRSVVAKPAELTRSTDLFSYGVDSVAGMQIRGKLRRLLPEEAKQLPINVVEDCGNVDKLADYVRRRRNGEVETDGNAAASDHEYMRKLVEEYSVFRTEKEISKPGEGHTGEDDGRDVVVLTGATGALGAHILSQYRADPHTKKIYCLVRGASENAAYERVEKALIQRQLPPLAADKKTVVLQAQLGDSHLGLSEPVYHRIAREATVIMHVAWSVNFRMKLRSFVKDNIAGVTNLLNLALASPSADPPRFAFCSSVASAMAYRAEVSVPEELLDDPAAATGLGYSQSKWVAEQICQRAQTGTKLRGRVVVARVGQLAGDSVHGVWNSKEAWPMMLSAVQVTGSLPALEDERLGWLPVDSAATALIQGVRATGKGEEGELRVFHVLNDHDRPTWMELLAWLGKLEEGFEILPPARWVEKLEGVVNGGSDHPAGQLLDHWRQAYGSSQDEGEGGVKDMEAEAQSISFAMTRTREALPVLRNVEPVSEAYFGKLGRWIKGNV